MAIKINGVDITSNKLNGGGVFEEKLNGVKVFPTVKINKWVYISTSSSPRGTSVIYEITSTDEYPSVELMEQKFPARDYNVGQFGEILWYDNYYLYQVQEV